MAKLSDNSFYVLYNIVGKITEKLANDIESSLWRDSLYRNTASGFLKTVYSESLTKSIYYAPRNPNDGFPPRQNTLKSPFNYTTFVRGGVSARGMMLYNDLTLDQGGRYRHKSLFGETEGDEVYPWIWIDEGRTYRNRFTGNPRNVNRVFTREWHSKGYRRTYINNLGNQLREKGWDVVK